MRTNLWNEADHAGWLKDAGPDPADQLVASRVYSSRLIGSDPDLVMHGGGNTSVKVRRRTLLGDEIDVLHVKGSGWNLDTLLAPGLPGLNMGPLHALRSLETLSDEDMVNIQRANLLDTTAPNPSVETLLHAYLPQAFVDHTHATGFLALANLPDGAAAVREIFGDRLAVVPYIMPGFALAKAAAEVFEAHPDCEGLVLLKHGHFTWGATARESYDRVIEHTNAVEDWLATRKGGRRFACTVNTHRRALDPARAQAVLPALRGAIAKTRGDHAGTAPRPIVADLRGGDSVETFLSRNDLPRLATQGTASPDHVIRTKGAMLHLTAADVSAGAEAIQEKLDAWSGAYREMFKRQNAQAGGDKIMLDPVPGVAWIEGVGIAGLGPDAAAAAAAADIAEQTIEVMTNGEAAGGFSPIPEEKLFELEYWSLEQAKLAKSRPRPLSGQVVAVTGGAGAIGLATARAFAADGAAVALVDRDGAAAEQAARDLSPFAFAVEADLSAPDAAEQALTRVTERFGGIDILVSNAGYAEPGLLMEIDEAKLRASFEVNFFAHLAMARAAGRVMRAQGTGGQMLFNVSKQAVNPGRGFGAYGLPKAATFFLVRQLALELGEDGIRVNGVNADRIRSGLLTDDFIRTRAAARGVTEADYMGGNLLGQEVEADHVARAFLALAHAGRTTAHVMTVDGGNIEAALR